MILAGRVQCLRDDAAVNFGPPRKSLSALARGFSALPARIP